MRALVLRERDDFATAIEGGSDHSGEPPLFTAIGHITGQIRELEAARRRFIAFGRHGVTGKPYTYLDLGAAAGKSETWAKEQADHPTAKTEALAAVAELRQASSGLVDPELAAMADVDQKMTNAWPSSRDDIIAQHTTTTEENS